MQCAVSVSWGGHIKLIIIPESFWIEIFNNYTLYALQNFYVCDARL